MRIVFMGTPQFSADILEELIHSMDVVAVYTQPDRVRSRGKKLVPTPVKVLAEKHGIVARTPASLKDADEVAYLESLAPDFICVAAYGMILPKQILEIPKYGCVNVHASLLPRWRGAAPIERAVLAGDENAGVCIMRMEEGLDTGDYCVSRQIPIAGMTSAEVESELASLGASALVVALSQIESGNANWTKQDDSKATYANKIEKGELNMDPSQTVEKNLRKVLASNAAHPCKAEIDGRQCTILKAEAAPDEPVAFGRAVQDGKRLILGCLDGSIEVLELKPAGKNAMEASAFLAGAKLSSEATWQ